MDQQVLQSKKNQLHSVPFVGRQRPDPVGQVLLGELRQLADFSALCPPAKQTGGCDDGRTGLSHERQLGRPIVLVQLSEQFYHIGANRVDFASAALIVVRFVIVAGLLEVFPESF